MKFRYTLQKGEEIKVLTPSLEGLAMKAYNFYVEEKGYQVIKREVEINGKFKEIL